MLRRLVNAQQIKALCIVKIEVCNVVLLMQAFIKRLAMTQQIFAIASLQCRNKLSVYL